MPTPTAAVLGGPRTAYAVAIWLACLAPLAVEPGGFVRFVFPKLLVVAAAVAVGAFAADRTDGAGLPKPVQGALLVALGAFVLAGALSATPFASLLGRWPRYEGLPVIAVYAGALWLGARTLGGRQRELNGSVLVHALSTAALVLGAASLLDAWGVSLASDVTRSGSLLGNATDQGTIGVLLVAVLGQPALARRAWFARVGLLAGLGVVLASGSRSALLALGVAVVIHVLAHPRRRTAVLAGASLVAAGTAALVLLDRFSRSTTVTGRWLLWKESWQLAREHLFLGLGPNRFVDAIGPFHDATWVRRVGPENPPDSPHDLALQVLLAGGVVLLLALVAAVVLGLRPAAAAAVADRDRPLQVGLLAAVLAYGAILLANFTSAGATCLALFLLGALIGVGRAELTRGRPRLVLRAGALALTVLMAGSCAAEIALQRGVDAAVAGRLPAARTAFSWAQHLRPGDTDVCMIAAQAYAAPGSAGYVAAAEEALKQARCSLQGTPTTLQSGIVEGAMLVVLGYPDQALPVLDRFARLYPTSPEVVAIRAQARMRTGDLAGAAADRDRAAALAPAR